MTDKKLSGKVAIVTGCGCIGTAIARQLLTQGAELALFDVSIPALAQKETELRADFGDALLCVPADMTDEAAINDAMETVSSKFGHIDILVNNLGLCRTMSIRETSREFWDTSLAVNLTSAMLCTKLVIDHMDKAGGGSIVNISSQASTMGVAGCLAYSASKAGMNGLTVGSAIELAQYNIRVNAVAPHCIDTPVMIEDSRRNAKRIPMNRPGTPEEIAKVVAFVAGDDASFLNGQCLFVNGGFNINAFNSVLYQGE